MREDQAESVLKASGVESVFLTQVAVAERPSVEWMRKGQHKSDRAY